MAAADFWEVALYWGSSSGNQWANVLCYQQVGDAPDDIAEIEDLVNNVIRPKFLSVMSEDCGGFACQVTNLTRPNVPVHSFSMGPLTGNITGDYIPTFNAVVIALYGLGVGRSQMGRVYVAGIGETLVSSGTIRSQSLSAFNDLIGAFNQPLLSTNSAWTSTIRSRKLGTFYPTIGVELRPAITRLRRRQLRIMMA